MQKPLFLKVLVYQCFYLHLIEFCFHITHFVYKSRKFKMY